MKKSTIKFMLFCILQSFIVMNAYSQLSKGNIRISPAFSYSSHNENPNAFIPTKGSQSIVGLDMQYFLVDNLAIGASLQYGFNKIVYTEVDEEQRFTDIGIGPVIDYFIPLSEKFFLSAGASVKYLIRKRIDEQFPDDRKLKGIGYSILGGIHYFIDNNLGIYLGLSPYWQNVSSDKSGISLERKTSGIRAQLGLEFIF